MEYSDNRLTNGYSFSPYCAWIMDVIREGQDYSYESYLIHLRQSIAPVINYDIK